MVVASSLESRLVCVISSSTSTGPATGSLVSREFFLGFSSAAVPFVCGADADASAPSSSRCPRSGWCDPGGTGECLSQEEELSSSTDGAVTYTTLENSCPCCSAARSVAASVTSTAATSSAACCSSTTSTLAVASRSRLSLVMTVSSRWLSSSSAPTIPSRMCMVTSRSLSTAGASLRSVGISLLSIRSRSRPSSTREAASNFCPSLPLLCLRSGEICCSTSSSDSSRGRADCSTRPSCCCCSGFSCSVAGLASVEETRSQNCFFSS